MAAPDGLRVLFMHSGTCEYESLLVETWNNSAPPKRITKVTAVDALYGRGGSETFALAKANLNRLERVTPTFLPTPRDATRADFCVGINVQAFDSIPPHHHNTDIFLVGLYGSERRFGIQPQSYHHRHNPKARVAARGPLMRT
jgi:hypothetical protein